MDPYAQLVTDLATRLTQSNQPAALAEELGAITPEFWIAALRALNKPQYFHPLQLRRDLATGNQRMMTIVGEFIRQGLAEWRPTQFGPRLQITQTGRDLLASPEKLAAFTVPQLPVPRIDTEKAANILQALHHHGDTRIFQLEKKLGYTYAETVEQLSALHRAKLVDWSRGSRDEYVRTTPEGSKLAGKLVANSAYAELT